MLSVMTRHPQPPGAKAWAKKLKALREKLDITQQEAADRLGVPVRTWISWENKQHVPSHAAQILLRMIFPDLR